MLISVASLAQRCTALARAHTRQACTTRCNTKSVAHNTTCCVQRLENLRAQPAASKDTLPMSLMEALAFDMSPHKMDDDAIVNELFHSAFVSYGAVQCLPRPIDPALSRWYYMLDSKRSDAVVHARGHHYSS